MDVTVIGILQGEGICNRLALLMGVTVTETFQEKEFQIISYNSSFSLSQLASALRFVRKTLELYTKVRQWREGQA